LKQQKRFAFANLFCIFGGLFAHSTGEILDFFATGQDLFTLVKNHYNRSEGYLAESRLVKNDEMIQTFASSRRHSSLRLETI